METRGNLETAEHIDENTDGGSVINQSIMSGALKSG